MSQPQRILAFGAEPARAPYRLRLARYKALAEAVARCVRKTRAAPDATVRLLDVGVGSGRTLRFLEAEGIADAVELHGIDFDRRRLANVYRPERWTLVEGDIRAGIAYPDGHFDIAICEQVLEHVARPERVLLELARILRPGGLLIAGVPTFPPVVSRVRRHVVPALDKLAGKRRGHVQVFTKRRIARLIEGTGAFDVVAVRGFRFVSGGFLIPLEHFRWWWRLNRAAGKLLPSLCTEVQVLARRKETAAGPDRGGAPRTLAARADRERW